jgi:hypothetical protein
MLDQVEFGNRPAQISSIFPSTTIYRRAKRLSARYDVRYVDVIRTDTLG